MICLDILQANTFSFRAFNAQSIAINDIFSTFCEIRRENQSFSIFTKWITIKYPPIVIQSKGNFFLSLSWLQSEYRRGNTNESHLFSSMRWHVILIEISIYELLLCARYTIFRNSQIKQQINQMRLLGNCLMRSNFKKLKVVISWLVVFFRFPNDFFFASKTTHKHWILHLMQFKHCKKKNMKWCLWVKITPRLEWIWAVKMCWFHAKFIIYNPEKYKRNRKNKWEIVGMWNKSIATLSIPFRMRRTQFQSQNGK